MGNTSELKLKHVPTILINTEGSKWVVSVLLSIYTCQKLPFLPPLGLNCVLNQL